MKNFEWYEFSALLLPGALLLYGLSLLFTDLNLIVKNADFSIGDLGLFTLLSFATGHIIQALGNLIESIWWKFCGKPTDWIRRGKGNLVSEHQFKKLELDIPIKLNLKTKPFVIKEQTEANWFGITRQMYVAIGLANQNKRIDIFNAAYGLTRGLTSSLIVLSSLTFLKYGITYWITLILALLSVVMLIRMRRFGIHYARELFIQFLQLK